MLVPVISPFNFNQPMELGHIEPLAQVEKIINCLYMQGKEPVRDEALAKM